MLYLLKLNFKALQKIGNTEYYYHLLGAILNVFDDDEKIYKSILKISYIKYNHLQIRLTINGQDAYSEILKKILSKGNLNISINGQKFELEKINFDFDIFDIEKINFVNFKKFKINYISPTFIRNRNILYTLPNPDKFIFSTYQKLNKIYNIGYDENKFKNFLKNNIYIYIGEFSIMTKQLKLKKYLKSGLVGYVWYYTSSL
ncbi:hypothetical protein [Candidatus Vampirococcus lugosii]|uniref:Uncharacterized protein n=1 Tax=Candidatus Vampirococcus lugosii TaxID=2789015 RepID=A0ABS5QLZ0_9BACT|nr:hypothetical protein [Candidatus Vampirococcus lugosii]MBS8121731.1 hypothetical protein [Candidatus Vampirococcus lugosii]